MKEQKQSVQFQTRASHERLMDRGHTLNSVDKRKPTGLVAEKWIEDAVHRRMNVWAECGGMIELWRDALIS